MVSPFDASIDDEADKRYDVGEEIQFNLVLWLGVIRLNHILKRSVVGHNEAQEKEGHHFSVKVQGLGTVLENVAEGLTHVDPH